MSMWGTAIVSKPSIIAAYYFKNKDSKIKTVYVVKKNL